MTGSVGEDDGCNDVDVDCDNGDDDVGDDTGVNDDENVDDKDNNVDVDDACEDKRADKLEPCPVQTSLSMPCGSRGSSTLRPLIPPPTSRCPSPGGLAIPSSTI